VGLVAESIWRLTTDWTVRDRIPVGKRFSAPVQTCPGAHPAPCKMGTGSFPGVKCGRGVLLTTHPLLVSRSWNSRAIPLPTLWATPGLERDHFIFLPYRYQMLAPVVNQLSSTNWKLKKMFLRKPRFHFVFCKFYPQNGSVPPEVCYNTSRPDLKINVTTIVSTPRFRSPVMSLSFSMGN